MKHIKVLTIILLIFIDSMLVFACKSPAWGPEYPITNFAEYDDIVIARVHKAIHSEGRYQGLKTFNLTIRKTLKGNLKAGNQISGKAKKEKPRAVCPIHFDVKSEYLLLLTKSTNGYRLSRFSLPVKKSQKYFNDYISQIEKILKME